MTKVLIAEDNKTVSAYLEGLMHKAGSQTVTVDNGMDAWRTGTAERFDVLLVDIVMQGLDGFVLAQKLLHVNPEMQVIFITGFSGVAMDTMATPSYSPAPITMRPFHLREIASRVRYLLGIGGLPASAFAEPHTDGHVIYADFSAKAHEHAVSAT